VDVTLDPDTAHPKQPSSMSGPRGSGQAEKAWKPSVKRSDRTDEDKSEFLKTQELYKRIEIVLNQLTPQMFQPLMKQVMKLTIDTEERLKGVIDLIYEKAISEPNSSEACANMCRCLMG
ncbi:hypothetical protein cypCar_00049187, partial [Cyprinus carpio]